MADVASQIIRVNEVEWSPMVPNVKAKVLWSDPVTKRRAQLTRFEPGASLPMHRHVGDELLYVIEGAISDEHGTTTAGNVGYRPVGCVHSVSCKNGATVLAVVTGGVEPAGESERCKRLQTITKTRPARYMQHKSANILSIEYWFAIEEDDVAPNT